MFRCFGERVLLTNSASDTGMERSRRRDRRLDGSSASDAWQSEFPDLRHCVVFLRFSHVCTYMHVRINVIDSFGTVPEECSLEQSHT